MSILVRNKSKVKNIFCLIILISGLTVSAQKCICKSYQRELFEDEAIDIFSFKNGEQLKICPSVWYNFYNDEKKYFRDFAIEQCKNDSIVFVGKSYTFYTLELKEDTLIVNELVDLPTGKDRSPEHVILSNTIINLENGKFKIINQFNPIRKYTSKEILLTLSECESKGNISNKKITRLISRLFVAALSDEKAKQYFINLSNKFSITEGQVLERYQNLMELFVAIQSNQYRQ